MPQLVWRADSCTGILVGIDHFSLRSGVSVASEKTLVEIHVLLFCYYWVGLGYSTNQLQLCAAIGAIAQGTC